MYMYYTALTKTNKAETAVLLSAVVHSAPSLSLSHSPPFTPIAMMYYTALMKLNKAETAVLLSANVHSPSICLYYTALRKPNKTKPTALLSAVEYYPPSPFLPPFLQLLDWYL